MFDSFIALTIISSDNRCLIQQSVNCCGRIIAFILAVCFVGDAAGQTF